MSSKNISPVKQFAIAAAASLALQILPASELPVGLEDKASLVFNLISEQSGVSTDNVIHYFAGDNYLGDTEAYSKIQNAINDFTPSRT